MKTPEPVLPYWKVTYFCDELKNWSEIDLIRCGQVSIRFRNICQDAELWKKINLCGKKVPSTFIQNVLDNGCRYLSLANSRVNGTLDLTKQIYPVKYLDLSNCDASNDTVLEELVGSCYSLQKLSLSKLTLGLHSNMVQNIVQNGFTLKVRPIKWLSTERKKLELCKLRNLNCLWKFSQKFH